MEGQNYLGIYLSKHTATVVCLGSQGQQRNVLDYFSVSVEEQKQADTSGGVPELANLIAQGCAERGLKFSEVAVALDCAMFMQHNVHSEFNDPKQIGATIRFDTEESLATDITDIAITFKITSSDQAGSTLAVFTARQKVLSEIILSLQSNNIDAVSVEPDVNCLSRFICQNVPLPEDLRPLFGILSQRNGYFIAPQPARAAEPQKQPLMPSTRMRTFLVGPRQNRCELLAREIPVTATLFEDGEPINYLKVFDSSDTVNHQQLSEKLGIEAGEVDLAEAAAISPDVLADCADKVDFAIAYGAALAGLEKVHSINFRNDFMPYQGRKIRLQKTLKFIGISVVCLAIALGLHFQLQLLQKNRPRSLLRSRFAKQYSDVMLGNKLPAKFKDAVKKLKSEVRRIENVKKGQLSATGELSVAAKLTKVLEAFNSCAAQTNLKIETISISAKTIRIVGDTSSRKNTLKLRKSIEKSRLKILKDTLELKGGRDVFSITVVPKK